MCVKRFKHMVLKKLMSFYESEIEYISHAEDMIKEQEFKIMSLCDTLEAALEVCVGSPSKNTIQLPSVHKTTLLTHQKMERLP